MKRTGGQNRWAERRDSFLVVPRLNLIQDFHFEHPVKLRCVPSSSYTTRQAHAQRLGREICHERFLDKSRSIWDIFQFMYQFSNQMRDPECKCGSGIRSLLFYFDLATTWELMRCSRLAFRVFLIFIGGFQSRNQQIKAITNTCRLRCILLLVFS